MNCVGHDGVPLIGIADDRQSGVFRRYDHHPELVVTFGGALPWHLVFSPRRGEWVVSGRLVCSRSRNALASWHPDRFSLLWSGVIGSFHFSKTDGPEDRPIAANPNKSVMWTFQKEQLDEGRVLRVVVQFDSTAVSYRDVLNRWQNYGFEPYRRWHAH